MTTQRPGWIQVFLDPPVDSFEEAVAFWSAVTGWRTSERRGEDGQFLTLVPAAGAPYVRMRAVDGPPGLDLASADRAADTARHVGLGATVRDVHGYWTVLTAPGGQVYCLTDRDPLTGTVSRAV